MTNQHSHPYFYGGQADTFSYYRIPRALITGREFRHVSTDAKLLYGLLLDRMGLSSRNGWFDSQGRVFIYYTLEEIQTDLNCGRDKAMKLLAELDTPKGVGLIERVRQGLGRPTIIYVKQFTTTHVPPQPDCLCGADLQRSEKTTSGSRESPPLKVEKSDPIYLEKNYLEKNYQNPSICLSGWTDESTSREALKEQISYSKLTEMYGADDVEGIVDLVSDVLSSSRPTLRIGGEELPVAQVKERFHRLDSEHIQYVLDRLAKVTTPIQNIRAYLLTALYNAPATINHYYQTAVQHDLYGDSS